MLLFQNTMVVGVEFGDAESPRVTLGTVLEIFDLP